jgi:DNA repair protein SbcC/Rad50
MKLNKIVLENIRSYTHSTLDIPGNSVLLSGDIGSGKSTILLAIEFALFGLRKGELSGEALLRKGTKEGYVELSFSIGENKYLIKRVLKTVGENIAQKNGYIVENEEKKDLSPVELKQRVLEILNYPSELLTKSKAFIFRYTVFTPQEEMKSILLGDSSVRLDTLRRIFGIDKYKRVRDNSKIITQRLRERIRNFEGRTINYDNLNEDLRKNNEELNNQKENLLPVGELISKLTLEIAEKKNKIEEIKLKIEEKNELVKNKEVKENSLGHKKEKINKNKEELIKLDFDIIKIKEEIKDIDVIFNEIQLKKTKVEEVKLKREERNKLVNGKELKEVSLNHKVEKLSKIKEDLVKLNEEIARLKLEVKEVRFNEDDLVKLRQELIDLELKIKELESKNQAFNIRINNSSEIIEKIELISDCPVCKQKVSDEHKYNIKIEENSKITSAKNQLIELSSNLDLLQNNLQEKKKNYEKMLEDKSRVESMKLRKDNLESKYKLKIDLENEMKLLDNEITVLNGEISLLGNKINEIKILDENIEIEVDGLMKKHKQLELQKNDLGNKVNLKENYEKELIELEKDVLDINNELVEYNNKIDFLKDINDLEIKMQLDSLLRRQSELEVKKAEISTKIESYEKNIDELKIKIEALNKIKIYLNELRELKEYLDKEFVDSILEIERKVMMKIHQDFNDLFSKWFDLLVEDPNLKVSIDEEFSVIVDQNNYKIDYLHLSGGEKTAAALAYRLALNQVINNLVSTIKTKDLIILDEPTDGFSDEQLDRLKVVLDELNMGQVLIVSHEPKIEGFVDSVVRIEKKNHVSSII